MFSLTMVARYGMQLAGFGNREKVSACSQLRLSTLKNISVLCMQELFFWVGGLIKAF